MLFYRRTGARSGVIFGPFGVLGLLAVIGLIGQALQIIWPVLVGAAVLYAVYIGWRAVLHRNHTDKDTEGCLFCHNYLVSLQRREDQEREWEWAQAYRAEQAREAERLREKYRR